MPNYKTHVSASIFIYLVVVWFFSLFYVPAIISLQWLICAIAGSLFPDVDIKSKGQQFFFSIILITVLFAVSLNNYQFASFLSVFSFMPLFFKHRGLFHNLWFLSFMTLSITFFITEILPGHEKIVWTNSLFFLLGIISHLWLDFGFKRMIRLR